MTVRVTVSPGSAFSGFFAGYLSDAFGWDGVFLSWAVVSLVGTLLLEIAKFWSSRIGTMLLEIGGVFVLTMLGWDGFASKLATQIVIFVANYLLSKFFAFRGKE